MSGLICTSCGGLLHVGLGHICPTRMDQAELDRRQRRATRFQATLNASMNELAAQIIAGMSAQVPRTYTVIPEPPPASPDPIRVQAYVGHRLAEIETRGHELIDGELA